MLGFPSLIFVGIDSDRANALNIKRLSSTNTGAEIAGYDPVSRNLYITNPNNTLTYFNISNPSNPGTVSTIDLSPYGGGVNSVSVKNGVVAVAVEANTVTDPGKVVFFDTNGQYQNQVTVGALPDMLTFTPDGKKILVANEAEARGGVNPDGSISIIDVSNGILNPTVSTADFTPFNSQIDSLRNSGVRIAPGQTVAQDVEPEYIAVSPDSTKAWVSLQENNAIAVVDLVNQQIESISPLGTKNYNAPGNAFDPSDRDSGFYDPTNPGKPAVRINNWPVLGMYMPDAIASVTVNGQTYIVSANEGDARDGEETRVGNIPTDDLLLPDAATLKLQENLGRLNVSTLEGRDANGKYTALYSYGGRSFSLWNANSIGQVFDSGDDFEQITSAFSPTPLTPSIYNSNGNPSSFDDRSDNRGPEPEGLAVGYVGNQLYSFIGLERTGGFMVYDITDPLNPVYNTYVNDWQLDDISPEGLLFISAEDSPTAEPLIVVTNEVSRNVVIYSATNSVTPTSVPEPRSLGMLGAATAIALGLRLSKRVSKIRN